MWNIHASRISHTSPSLSRFEEERENGKGKGPLYVGIMKEKIL
jgi:hypothetical protein